MKMFDPVTGWFEQAQLYGTLIAYICQQILDTMCLAQYPYPREIRFENGEEFKTEFVHLCRFMGLIENTSLP